MKLSFFLSFSQNEEKDSLRLSFSLSFVLDFVFPVAGVKKEPALRSQAQS